MRGPLLQKYSFEQETKLVTIGPVRRACIFLKKKREHFARLGWQVNSIYIYNQCWRTIWPLGINHSIQTVLVKGKDTTEKGKDTTGDIFALSNRIHIWKILNRSLIDSALSVKMINMC